MNAPPHHMHILQTWWTAQNKIKKSIYFTYMFAPSGGKIVQKNIKYLQMRRLIAMFVMPKRERIFSQKYQIPFLKAPNNI